MCRGAPCFARSHSRYSVPTARTKPAITLATPKRLPAGFGMSAQPIPPTKMISCITARLNIRIDPDGSHPHCPPFSASRRNAGDRSPVKSQERPRQVLTVWPCRPRAHYPRPHASSGSFLEKWIFCWRSASSVAQPSRPWQLRGANALLFALTPRDPTTFLGAIGVLIVIALLACSRTALRASHVDATAALRSE